MNDAATGGCGRNLSEFAFRIKKLNAIAIGLC